MAKNENQESPADRVKREMAEREQREKEAAEAASQQKTADTLSPAEQAAVKAAEEQSAKDKELASLRDQLVKKEKELEGAKSHISTLQEDAAKEEDPAIVEERRRRFERAEQFEREHRRPRADIMPKQPTSEDDERVNVTGSGDRRTVSMSVETFEKIYKLATSIPLSTPPEHIMTGYGGVKLTVGMIRDMAGVRMR